MATEESKNKANASWGYGWGNGKGGVSYEDQLKKEYGSKSYDEVAAELKRQERQRNFHKWSERFPFSIITSIWNITKAILLRLAIGKNLTEKRMEATEKAEKIEQLKNDTAIKVLRERMQELNREKLADTEKEQIVNIKEMLTVPKDKQKEFDTLHPGLRSQMEAALNRFLNKSAEIANVRRLIEGMEISLKNGSVGLDEREEVAKDISDMKNVLTKLENERDSMVRTIYRDFGDIENEHFGKESSGKENGKEAPDNTDNKEEKGHAQESKANKDQGDTYERGNGQEKHAYEEQDYDAPGDSYERDNGSPEQKAGDKGRNDGSAKERAPKEPSYMFECLKKGVMPAGMDTMLCDYLSEKAGFEKGAFSLDIQYRLDKRGNTVYGKDGYPVLKSMTLSGPNGYKTDFRSLMNFGQNKGSENRKVDALILRTATYFCRDYADEYGKGHGVGPVQETLARKFAETMEGKPKEGRPDADPRHAMSVVGPHRIYIDYIGEKDGRNMFEIKMNHEVIDPGKQPAFSKMGNIFGKDPLYYESSDPENSKNGIAKTMEMASRIVDKVDSLEREDIMKEYRETMQTYIHEEHNYEAEQDEKDMGSYVSANGKIIVTAKELQQAIDKNETLKFVIDGRASVFRFDTENWYLMKENGEKGNQVSIDAMPDNLNIFDRFINIDSNIQVIETSIGAKSPILCDPIPIIGEDGKPAMAEGAMRRFLEIEKIEERTGVPLILDNTRGEPEVISLEKDGEGIHVLCGEREMVLDDLMSSVKAAIGDLGIEWDSIEDHQEGQKQQMEPDIYMPDFDNDVERANEAYESFENNIWYDDQEEEKDRD